MSSKLAPLDRLANAMKQKADDLTKENKQLKDELEYEKAMESKEKAKAYFEKKAQEKDKQVQERIKCYEEMSHRVSN